jgi:peptidoglycan-associated lipoprotein
MFKNICVLIICVLLTACAGISGSHESYQGSASKVITQGLIDDATSLQILNSDIGPHDGVFGIRNFYFAFDSNLVDLDDIVILRQHAKYMLDNPDMHIVLEGNTDDRGSREYNVALGQRRANAIKEVLLIAGVPSKRIEVISFGAEKPVAFGHSEKAYRLNRRVDLRYTR